MAYATTDQIWKRLEAIGATIAGLSVLTGDEQKIAPVHLPVLRVQAAESTSTRDGSGQLRHVRTWELFLFAKEVGKLEDEAAVQAALEACSQYIDSIYDAYAGRPSLELNDNGLVIETGDMSDSGPGITPYLQKSYGAVKFLLPITTVRRVTLLK